MRLTEEQEKSLFKMVYDWGYFRVATDYTCNAFQEAISDIVFTHEVATRDIERNRINGTAKEARDYVKENGMIKGYGGQDETAKIHRVEEAK